MGNSHGYRRSGLQFGTPAYHMMYGGRRSLPSLSNRSSGQVEDAKKKFLHFVFEVDFDFMPDTAKLKLQIFDHMTKDARVTVRDYVKSMGATSVFRANQQLQRELHASNRIFQGNCTITKATKEYILEHKVEDVRELFVIEELALCTFFCFAGVPHCDASGWILDDIVETEFESITDIAQYLTRKATVWKKPKHCTAYTEFTGRIPKNLQQQLQQRNAEVVHGRQKQVATPFAIAKKKKQVAKKKEAKVMKKKVLDDQDDEDDEDDDDIEILNPNHNHNNHNRKRSIVSTHAATLTDFWGGNVAKKRKLDHQ